MKKYLNISEVSELLDIKEYIIRYWDSIDPKTNQLRVEGISTKSKKGTRYFNKENISKLKKMKAFVYENGKHNNSLRLAHRLVSMSYKNKKPEYSSKNITYIDNPENAKKINQILKKMRIIVKLNNNY
tara:strand:- start:36 stop:419 length:384 start_codon:yes stop_codon:yes gene_type:complete